MLFDKVKSDYLCYFY